MRINKEGYKIIFFSGVVCLLIWWGFYRLLVTDAAIQEDKPLTPRGAGCLTLYFPVDGEEVWEIAKRYGTSPAAIQAENGLGDDGAVGTGMLLIPAVR